MMAQQKRPLWDFEDVGDWWTRVDESAMVPVVAVPTTSGTGSEVGAEAGARAGPRAMAPDAAWNSWGGVGYGSLATAALCRQRGPALDQA